ncbi:unnamed protein product [Strongylus vulgaris]|uniref:Uncharacterized protein n=1 Tax=Strongylus vulgaris TaxID=40348 RepID=A0A3P7LRC1_STRVU|nr:unnamed protein product [Strongylus vulgaris]
MELEEENGGLVEVRVFFSSKNLDSVDNISSGSVCVE